MIALRYAAAAAVAACLGSAVLVDSANARGGGSGGHAVASHAAPAVPHLLQPLAAAPGGGQKSGAQLPTKSQIDIIPAPMVPTVPDAALPPSALASPETQPPPIAPLSPPVTTTFAGSGGTARPDALTSAADMSTSPSEVAPSVAGGGGDTLADCMGFWDAQTHMSKGEWRAACLRVQNRFAGMKN